MKIKMAASMLLCSFVILCSEVSAAGLSSQLLQGAGCGCEAAPAVEDCGCEAAADEGCGCRQPVRGLLSKLRSGGCGGGCAAAAVPAPVVDCGCEAAPVADCGCEAAPSCGCKSGGLKGLLQRMGGQVSGDCGCGPTCEEPAPVVEESCGCAPEPAPSCGCEAAAAPARKCGCQMGGLLGRLRSRSCGCGSAGVSNGSFGGVYEPVVAPAADCGCAAAPAAAPSCGCGKGGLLGRLTAGGCGCGSAAAPAADCGCAPEPAPAPVADCGCAAAPAAAPSCGGGKGGLLGRLTAGGCGCGSAAAPAADCGCAPAPAPAPVAGCGCAAAPAAAPSCGGGNGGLLGRLGSGGCGCGSAAADCGCDDGAVGSSCGSNDGLLAGRQLGQRLTGGCNRCGKSSCNGGCHSRSRRNSGGLTLLNKLRGDRIVRDTSNCGRCMPACPTKGCDSGCGCSSCGDAAGGVVYDYAPSMEMAPAIQPMAPVAVPATTEGSIVPSAVVPTGAMKKIQPVVDSAAFILRNQK